MSLPAAKKQTTEKPAAGAVIEPVNKANKDADVERKLKLFGVIQAFRQGRLPDNGQIDATLKYVVHHSPIDDDKLSPEGRKLIQDTKDIIETARLIVAEKNADELFQNFMWHTRGIDTEHLKKDSKGAVPDKNVEVQDNKEQAVQHLRTLLNLIMTNSEVRKLLTDFSFIGRDLLAKAAEKVAENIKPTEDQLAGVNDPAPQDQFVTKNGKTTDTSETPVLQARLPGTDTDVVHDPRQPEPEVSTNGQGTSASNVVEEQRQRFGEAKESARQELKSTRDQLSDESTDQEAKKRGLMGKMREFRNGLGERIPQEHKDRAGDNYDRAKHFLLEDYFPEERRDQFIYRGKKIIIECQKHDDYQASLRWLLDILEGYRTHGKQAARDASDQGSRSLTSDPALKQATNELRTLLERFADGRSMDQIFDAINALYDDANRDKELKDWFRSVNSYSRKVLLEAGYVLEDECNTRGREIRESGRKFYDVQYKENFDNLFETIGNWFAQMGKDPLNKRFGEDWARLTKDLLFDSEGSLKFKSMLWDDIRKVILPTLIDKIGYLPIPRVEYTDDSLDLVIENLTLSGKNLLPNIVTLEAKNYFKFSPYNVVSDKSSHEIELGFRQIQADMRDVAFYFRRKTGIPKITDAGLADIVLGGEGVNVTVKIVSSSNDRSSVFKVKSVHVKVDSLKFSIRDSKHDFLYKTLKPLATGLVKKQIQKAIQDGVRTGLEYVDGQLVAVRDRMEAAKAEEGTGEGKTRMQVLQEMFQRKKEEATSSTKSRESQFKVVSKRDSAILPSTGHPAGWVNRAAEHTEAASKGQDWRSDAFAIVM